MVTVNATGSQTATVGVEHTLANPVTSKFFTGYVDLTNMVSGDTVEIRVYLIVKSAGAYVLYYLQTYSGAQTNDAVYIPPLPSGYGYKLTLKQVSGTGRVFDFSLYEI